MLKKMRYIAFDEKEGMKCSLWEKESELSKDHKFKVKPVNKVVCTAPAIFDCIRAVMK